MLKFEDEVTLMIPPKKTNKIFITDLQINKAELSNTISHNQVHKT